MTIMIYALKMRESNVGDNLGAEAVATIMAEQFGASAFVSPVDETQLDQLNEGLRKTSAAAFSYVVAMGVQWKEALKNLPEGKAKTVFISHQMFDGIDEVADTVDLIALPDHAVIDDAMRARSNFTATVGVPHGLRPVELEDKAQATRARFEALQGHALGSLVILGGDAPNESGRQRYYTQDEAQRLGHGLAHLHSKGALAVTDGPRTAKFDPMSGLQTDFHKGDAPTNPVMEAFMRGLQTPSVVHDIPVAVSEFRFGQESDYKGLLGLVGPETKIWVPGESTSMITEATDLFDPRQVIVYETGSMNQTHFQHVSNTRDKGQCWRYTMKGKLLEPIDGFGQANVIADRAAFVSQDARAVADAALKLKMGS